MVLVVDPGRPSTPRLGLRFIRSELRSGARRLSRVLGLRKLNDAVPSDWATPDSELAVKALQTATSKCPEYMIRHCVRSYSFGAILASRNGLKLDKELFFVAAMLHDLGLSEEHVNDPGSFEWVGAKLAYDFCLSEEQAAARAEVVHNSIALHTSMGTVDGYQPEIKLLHYGTGMDLFGMRVEEIPSNVLDDLLTSYPRDGFKETFSPCLQHQADTKPNSQIAAAVGIGITDRVLESLKS